MYCIARICRCMHRMCSTTPGKIRMISYKTYARFDLLLYTIHGKCYNMKSFVCGCYYIARDNRSRQVTCNLGFIFDSLAHRMHIWPKKAYAVDAAGCVLSCLENYLPALFDAVLHACA